MTPSPAQDRLTIAQLCKELGISRSTFYKWRAKGRAPRCIKLPNGEIRIRRAELERWLDSLVRRPDGHHLRRAHLEDPGEPARQRETYTVRWRVAGHPWKETFKTRALADSFRSELLSAARKGEAFDTATGRPVSAARAGKDLPWYRFACAFVDMKWPRVAATTRRTHAEA